MHLERLARADPRWLAEYQRYTSLWDEGQYGGSNPGGSNPAYPGTAAYQGGSAGAAVGSSSGAAPASLLVGQDWADSVWESVGAGLGAMRPRDLAMLLHGMSVLGLRPGPGVLQLLGSYLEERGGEMSAMQDCQVSGVGGRQGDGAGGRHGGEGVRWQGEWVGGWQGGGGRALGCCSYWVATWRSVGAMQDCQVSGVG